MASVYARWIVRHRVSVILAVLAVVAMAAAGLPRVQFTTDYRVFFSSDNPQLQAFEALQNTYTKNDNILMVVAPRDGQVFTRRTLASLEALTREAWQTPYSIRVDSITNFQYTRADGDDLIVTDLISGAETLADDEIAALREVALNEPLLVNRLLSPSTHVTAVNITLQLPGEAPQREVPEAATFARQLAAQAKAENPELDIYLTGIVMMNNAFSEATQRDLQSLVPAMFAVVIGVLAILLRSLVATLVTVLIIAFSIVTAMGLVGWLGMAMTPPSSAAPTIILTLAVAHSVHILMTFLSGMRHGQDKPAALVESLRINLQPVFLTSLTTAFGFLSMNFSDAPPFRDLGNIVAMGVAAAFVYAVTFLPAVIMLLPMRVRPVAETGRAMARFAEFVVGRRNVLMWGMLVVVVVLAAQVPRNELNDEFVKYFDESVRFRQDTDFTSENLTGIYVIEYSLGAGASGGINDPAYLRRIAAFAEWFRAQPETLHVNVLTDTMRRLNKNMHGDDPAWYRLPDDRELSAQYLLLYELSLPFGLDLNNQINVDKSATRMTVTLRNLSTNQLLALEQRAQAWLREHTPPSMHSNGSSPSIMFAHIGARNIRSMLTGTTVALVLISATLLLALRSVRIGLISLLPNLIPAVMAFGLWGLFVGQVGLALSVVTGMTLGIVVDDTVHFLSKYLRARREREASPVDAVRYAFASVGMALWVTSLVLVAGFLVLTLSTFELNSGMGLLTAVTIALALTADFLLLPPLLMRVEERIDARRRTADSVEPATP